MTELKKHISKIRDTKRGDRRNYFQLGCDPDASFNRTAQVALAWLLTRPGVNIIIPGAKRPDQIASNIRTLDVHLNEDEIHEINEMFAMKP